jgi:hypothetical protein
MFKRKISKKAQKAAEKYLHSLGSSREQLTDKQWNVVANYSKKQRLIVPSLLLCGVLSAGLSFWTFQLSNKAVSSIIPSETTKVVFVFKANEEFMSQKSSSFCRRVSAATQLYWYVGATYIITISCFIAAFITTPLARRNQKKVLNPFIPRKTAEQKPS